MTQHITIGADDAGQRLDRYLKTQQKISYHAVQKFLRTGRIRVNKKRKSADYRLLLGDIISLPEMISKQESSASQPQAHQHSVPKDLVMGQNQDFLWLNKPAGLASQGGSGLRTNLDAMLPLLNPKGGSKLRLVHRLDKDTSGVMIIAMNREAATLASAAFADKQIQKYYLAIISGRLPKKSGVIDMPLKRDAQKVSADPSGEPAISHYHLLANNDKDDALVMLMPVTGRTHQLRVHMNHIGAMIIGDKKYPLQTVSPEISSKYLCLHAYRLCWQQEGLDVSIAPPPHFTDILTKAGLAMPDAQTLQRIMQKYQL